MPTYEYRCEACGYEFEQFQSITAAPLKTCPDCKKRSLNRLIGSGGGIIFKGSGFYQTDYRSESYKKAAEAETKAATPESKTSTADSKTPAAESRDKATADGPRQTKTASEGPKKSKKSASKTA